MHIVWVSWNHKHMVERGALCVRRGAAQGALLPSWLWLRCPTGARALGFRTLHRIRQVRLGVRHATYMWVRSVEAATPPPWRAGQG